MAQKANSKLWEINFLFHYPVVLKYAVTSILYSSEYIRWIIILLKKEISIVSRFERNFE